MKYLPLIAILRGITTNKVLDIADILIENGIISNIDFNIINPKNYKEINLTNLHVSRGWFDSSVSFGEPGAG